MPYSTDPNKPLSPQLKKFCEEYVANGCNATQAYLTVMAKTTKYPNKTAQTLLHNPRCEEYIHYLLDKQWQSMNITPSRIRTRLKEIGFNEDKEKYTAFEVMKAIEMIQKQMGLITNKVEADVKTQVIEVSIEDE